MYFPLFLDIKKSKFLIIGAGSVALAKLETLLEFSDNISVVARNITEPMADALKKNSIVFIQDSYDAKYLADADVIIAATNDSKVNQQISIDAKSAKKLINSVDDPNNSNFIFGASIKKGDVILSVSTSGTSPVLARLLKKKLQSHLPENLLLLNQFLVRNKDLVKQKLTNLQARRLFWQDVIEGVIGNEALLGNEEKAQKLLEDQLEQKGNKKSAAVYFIGAGPGDPELITIKAINLLSKADIVLYDRLVSPEILSYARKDALKINVGKSKDKHLYEQDEINQLIRKYAVAGNVVARLKGGDSGIFARLSEEIEAIIDLNIPYQIVPGITAASGAAAYAGIPLTSRHSNKSVRFLAMYKQDFENENYWKDLAKSEDTLVFYMSSHNLGEIAQNLVKYGKKPETPIAIIEQATTPFQKTYISSIADFSAKFGEKKFVSPSLAIIGDVVNLGHKWREEVLEGNYFQNIEVKNDRN